MDFLILLIYLKSIKLKNLFMQVLAVYMETQKNKIFKENDLTNKPLQIYAATKISNELIAHVYSHLYNF